MEISILVLVLVFWKCFFSFILFVLISREHGLKARKGSSIMSSSKSEAIGSTTNRKGRTKFDFSVVARLLVRRI
jgi:hypothetical protein